MSDEVDLVYWLILERNSQGIVARFLETTSKMRWSQRTAVSDVTSGASYASDAGVADDGELETRLDPSHVGAHRWNTVHGALVEGAPVCAFEFVFFLSHSLS